MDESLSSGDLFLAVDGGGSKTLGVVARLDGTVVSLGRGGPTNRIFATATECLRSSSRAIGGALNAQGVRGKRIRLAAFTGPGILRCREHWERRIQELVWVNEGTAALASANQSRGVVVIAGTGSGAGLIEADGGRTWAGGWGGLIGDEGSGYFIAVEALRMVAKAADSRIPPTELTQRALSFFGVDKPGRLVHCVHHPKTRRHHIAAFCREVLSLAEHDLAARMVLEHAVSELLLAARSGMRELSPNEAIPVVLSGGVFRGSPLARELFAEGLSMTHPGAWVITPRFAPAVGALLWAWWQKGYIPGEEVLSRLETTFAERDAQCH